jgi:hypothetical protein
LRFRLVALFSFVACVGLVGCGRGKGDVSGTVKINGTPLKGGVVTFVSTENGPSFTTDINPDGTYHVNDVLSGAYKVCVSTEGLRGRPLGAPNMGGGSSSMKGRPGGGGPGGPPDLVALAKSGKIKTVGSDSPEAKTPDALTALIQNAERYVPIPASYGRPETTDLTFTAGSGSQTFDITLTGKAP